MYAGCGGSCVMSLKEDLRGGIGMEAAAGGDCSGRQLRGSRAERTRSERLLRTETSLRTVYYCYSTTSICTCEVLRLLRCCLCW
jgi:hypothetical protein